MSKQSDNRNIRVLQFLDAYEKQESLWNPALKSYKDKAARDEAYMHIIKELKVPSLTIHDVRLKVKSIRTTYTKELRLLTKHKKEGTPYNPKLFWFNRANVFLKSVSLSRDRGQSRLTRSSQSSSDYKVEYITDISQRQSLLDDDGTDNLSSIEDDSGQNGSNSYDYKTLQPSDIESNTQEDDHMEDEVSTSKYNQHLEEEFKQQSTVNKPKLVTLEHSCNHNSSNSTSTSDDEYEIFCRSVAAQLRSIPDIYSRSVAKLKIQQILFEAETGHYRNSPCITIPVSQQMNNA